MSDHLLTPEEFHRAGGPTPKTLANWRVLGKGPKFIKVGRLIRYHPADIASYIDGRRVQSTSDYRRI